MPTLSREKRSTNMDNDRLDTCEYLLKEVYKYLNGTLTEDEAWLRIELSMLIHDLKVIKERTNG